MSTPTKSTSNNEHHSCSFFSSKLQEHDKNKVALVHGDKDYAYGQVNHQAGRLSAGLLSSSPSNEDNNNKECQKSSDHDLHEERIALFLSASLDYVTAMHGVWRAGGIVVPLHTAIVATEIEYYLTCASVTRIISNSDCLPQDGSLQALCQKLGVELLTVDDVLARAPLDSPITASLPSIDPARRAMILFTSGTTSKPKGVVTTHATICAQISTLVTAWAWTSDDVIPLFLPLHHVHGIINVLSCALWAGATVHLFKKFDVNQICHHVAAKSYTLFMAVPTVYVKILQHLKAQECVDSLLNKSSSTNSKDQVHNNNNKSKTKQDICDGFRAMRLNVSGSAACPVSLFEEWREVTGQTLLERYGMTEIGMALSNPYHGTRRAGCVGQPLPGVQVQLFAEESSSSSPSPSQIQPIMDTNVPGEIRVKGANVFLEYWNDPEATRKSFKDGWFCTGDIAVLESTSDDSQSQYYSYKIMGRSSVDIIKSGGYKLSALEIESVLLTHPQIAEVAVIGVPDETWGQIVVAFICLNKQNSKHVMDRRRAMVEAPTTLEYDDLKAWCKDKMSAYKIPKRIKVLDALPRNAMGKVTKPLLQSMV